MRPVGTLFFALTAMAILTMPVWMPDGCVGTAHAESRGGFYIKKLTDMTYTGNISQEDVNNILTFVSTALDKGLCCGWEIFFTDNFLVRIEVEDGKAYPAIFEGYTFSKDKEIHIYIYQPCLAASALIHELGHAMGEPGHLNKSYWENIENIKKEAIKRFCGKDYKVVPIPKPTDELKRLIIMWIDEILDQRSL